MRINQFVAQASGLSRRAADRAIADGQVLINGVVAELGDQTTPQDRITLDGKILMLRSTQTILLNKPVGYVCSRDGQGSKTIYNLLPPSLHHLKPIGRLDKDSSGLLLLTNDGKLAQALTHPKFEKQKVYEVTLGSSLTPSDQQRINKGIELDDGSSHLTLSGHGRQWIVRMSEGRNRQIRRTFAALGYTVVSLRRLEFGPYQLQQLKSGKYRELII